MTTKRKRSVAMMNGEQVRALSRIVEAFKPISDHRRKNLTGQYLKRIHGSISAILRGEHEGRVQTLQRAATVIGEWVARQDGHAYFWSIPLTDEEAATLRAVLECAKVLDAYVERYTAESLEIARWAKRKAQMDSTAMFALPPGPMQLAPFLSADGEPMLVVRGGDDSDSLSRSRLALHGLVSLTGADGWTLERDGAEGPECRGAVSTSDDLAHFWKHYGSLLPEGVHEAPWRPNGMARGGALVVVDRDSRLVAVLDFEDVGKDLIDAQRDANAILEIAQAQYTYRDSASNDSDEDDDDRHGEEWKG